MTYTPPSVETHPNAPPAPLLHSTRPNAHSNLHPHPARSGHHETTHEIYRHAAQVNRAGSWLTWTSVFELLSNGGPPWTMQFTGNCGEVVFLLGFVVAERTLAGG